MLLCLIGYIFQLAIMDELPLLLFQELNLSDLKVKLALIKSIQFGRNAIDLIMK